MSELRFISILKGTDVTKRAAGAFDEPGAGAYFDISAELDESDKALLSRVYVTDEQPDLIKHVAGLKELTGAKNIIAAIDFLQCMRINGKGDARQGYNQVCIDLKDAQKKTGSLLFLLSQLGREGSQSASKRYLLSYRETSEIENVSDVCLDIFLSEKKPGSLDLLLKKNKMGKRKVYWYSEVNAAEGFRMELKSDADSFENLDKKDEKKDENGGENTPDKGKNKNGKKGAGDYI